MREQIALMNMEKDSHATEDGNNNLKENLHISRNPHNIKYYSKSQEMQ